MNKQTAVPFQTLETWRPYIDECRESGEPVVPIMTGDAWFSVNYLCSKFLSYSQSRSITEACISLAIPTIRVNQTVCIRMQDLERIFFERLPVGN